LNSRPSTKTLFLVSSLTVGGSEVKTVRLANELAARGRGVVLAYLNPPETLLEQVSPAVQAVHLRRRGKFSLAALRALTELISRSDIATVVAVNLYAALYAVIARHLLGRKAPRVVVSVNTTDFESASTRRQMHLYRHVLRRADRIVFGARGQQQLWNERYRLDETGRRSMVIYNGVDTRRFHAGAVPGLRPAAWPDGRFVVGTVGTLRPEKAQTDLVKAVDMLARQGIDAGALIVGEGPERHALEALVESLGLHERVWLAGSQSDVRGYLAAMDVFALPSVAVETFSNATLEAMAMGRPVVVSRIGGMPEMLEGGGGVLFDPGDLQGLCAHLAALALEPARRRALAAAAVDNVGRHFNWNSMVEQYLKLLQP